MPFFRQPLECCSLLGCHWLVGGHRVQFLDRPGRREAALTDAVVEDTTCNNI